MSLNNVDSLVDAVVKRVYSDLSQLRLPPKRWATTAEAADYLKVDEDTLQHWRKKKRGPRFYEPSPRFIRYRYADLDRWLSREDADD